MIRAICIVLCLLPTLASPALAAPKVFKPTRAKQRALREVLNTLSQKYTADKYKIHAYPALVQPEGNPARPITGQRPTIIEAKVERKGGWFKRALHRLNPESFAAWSVEFKPRSAKVIDRFAMTRLARLRERLPLTVSDVLKSRGARLGSLTALFAGAAVTGGGVLAAGGLGGIGYAAVEIYRGVKRRMDRRRDAVAETAKWAKQSIKDGVTPTPSEAFATYKELLSDSGTTEGSLKHFLDRLATHGL